MREGLELRVFDEGRWPEARTLAARAFHGEPWVAAFFGPDPIRRFERAHQLYRAAAWAPVDLHLGAFVDDVLVGLCVASPEGECHLCEHVDPGAPPEDPVLLDDWRFEVNAQLAHADQGPHGWISRVVVDPVVQGAGIGKALVEGAVDLLRADGADAALLECQPHRASWYASRGFTEVRRFPDPAGPDAALMRVALAPALG